MRPNWSGDRDEISSLTERLAERDRDLQIAEIRERDLRSMLTDLQAVQLHRDSEIMATLGAVLSRHAPNAPASIYHRKLVGQVRQFVETHVPSGARMLVTTYGDEAMLILGDRATESFPRSARGVSADYTDVRGNEAIAQLETSARRRSRVLAGAEPSVAVAGHPSRARAPPGRAIHRRRPRARDRHDLRAGLTAGSNSRLNHTQAE